MKRNEVIFRVVAVAGLAIATAAYVRRTAELKVLNDTYLLIRTEVEKHEFANIVENYNEPGDSK